MCGIVAAFSNRNPIDPETLRRATQALHHRGPDGQKQQFAENRRVGLGHARLSIVDLATGEQPLSSQDGSILAVVNGEFYGHSALRSELQARGYHFKTRSDSEILLPLYQEYGTQCLEHLRGEFSFVLWDRANGLLFAARDRFGIKPLHYAEINGALWIASEVKALLAAGHPARWDLEATFDLSLSRLPLPEQTSFLGARQLPPGHLLMATEGGIQIRRYWDFNYPKSSDPSSISSSCPTIEENTDLLREALNEAIRLRMSADVPVAFYLSGGLDSCSILGAAATMSSTPLQAFTLSFEEPAYDEEAIAREMAERTGARIDSIRVTPLALAESFSDAVWHAETIFSNAHGVAKFLLSRSVRDAGYKAVLTGEGSDEIFGGYAHFRQDILLNDGVNGDSPQSRLLLEELYRRNPISKGLMLVDGNHESLVQAKRILGYAPSFIASACSNGEKARPYLDAAFLERFRSRDPIRLLLDHFDIPGQMKGCEVLHQSMYLYAKTFLANYNLTVLGDRMEMAHSIEGRQPFLDHLLVEAVTKIPGAQKIWNQTEKHLLREAAKPFLTDTVYRRQKHPFFAPPVRGDSPMFELIQDTLRSASFHKVPFYDHARVCNLLDRLRVADPAERAMHDPLLLRMMSHAFMQSRFGLSA